MRRRINLKSATTFLALGILTAMLIAVHVRVQATLLREGRAGCTTTASWKPSVKWSMPRNQAERLLLIPRKPLTVQPCRAAFMTHQLYRQDKGRCGIESINPVGLLLFTAMFRRFP